MQSFLPSSREKSTRFCSVKPLEFWLPFSSLSDSEIRSGEDGLGMRRPLPDSPLVLNNWHQ